MIKLNFVALELEFLDSRTRTCVKGTRKACCRKHTARSVSETADPRF